jgi:8-oxo-dGTP diphosphatase
MTDETNKVLVVTRCAIENDEGKILLVKRSKIRKYNPGKWELPGGKLQNALTLEDSTEKIAKHEVGLIVQVDREPIHAQSHFVTDTGKYFGYMYAEITFHAKYLTGDVKSKSEDLEEIKWLTVKEALALDLSPESRKSLTKFYELVGKRENPNKLPIILVARAIIKDRNGKILMLRRGDDDAYNGNWELPGGKMGSFEGLTDHLKREVFEETALVIEITKPSIHSSSLIADKGSRVGSTFINIISEARVKAGKLTLSNEHSDYGWFAPKDIFTLDLAHYIKVALTELLLPVSPKKS